MQSSAQLPRDTTATAFGLPCTGSRVVVVGLGRRLRSTGQHRLRPLIVTVTTTYAGANPDIIATQVTKPIEDAIATLSNIDSLTSTSTQGVSTVTVEFTSAVD